MTGQQLQQLIFRPGLLHHDRGHRHPPAAAWAWTWCAARSRRCRGASRCRATPGQGTRFVLTLPVELGSVAGAGGALRGAPVRACPCWRWSRRARRRARTCASAARARSSSTASSSLPVQDLGALLGLRAARVPAEGQPLAHPPVAGQAAGARGRRGGGRQGAGHPPAAVGGARACPPTRAPPRWPAASWCSSCAPTGWSRATARASRPRRQTGARWWWTTRSPRAPCTATVLEAGGFTCTPASSGAQALEQLRAQRLRRRHLRHRHGGDGRLPAHRAAARARPETRRHARHPRLRARLGPRPRSAALAAGADGFLSKSDCASGRLLAEVARDVMRAAEGGLSVKPIRVLVADDSPTMRAAAGGAAQRGPAHRGRRPGRGRRRGGGAGAPLRPDVITMDVKHAAARRPRAPSRPSWPRRPRASWWSARWRSTRQLELVVPGHGAPARWSSSPSPTAPARGAAPLGPEARRRRCCLMAEVPVISPAVARAPRAGRPCSPTRRAGGRLRHRRLHRRAARAGAASSGTLPRDLPVPMLVAQHITAGLHRRASCAGSSSVTQPARSWSPRTASGWSRACVYLPPDGQRPAVDARGLAHAARAGGRCPRATGCCRSLARVYGARAGGVVLTGMGDDGARGCWIRRPAAPPSRRTSTSSVVFGMPKAANA